MSDRLEDLDPSLAEFVNRAIDAIDQALGRPGETRYWDGYRWRRVEELSGPTEGQLRSDMQHRIQVFDGYHWVLLTPESPQKEMTHD